MRATLTSVTYGLLEALQEISKGPAFWRWPLPFRSLLHRMAAPLPGRGPCQAEAPARQRLSRWTICRPDHWKVVVFETQDSKLKWKYFINEKPTLQKWSDIIKQALPCLVRRPALSGYFQQSSHKKKKGRPMLLLLLISFVFVNL